MNDNQVKGRSNGEGSVGKLRIVVFLVKYTFCKKWGVENFQNNTWGAITWYLQVQAFQD